MQGLRGLLLSRRLAAGDLPACGFDEQSHIKGIARGNLRRAPLVNRRTKRRCRRPVTVSLIARTRSTRLVCFSRLPTDLDLDTCCRAERHRYIAHDSVVGPNRASDSSTRCPDRVGSRWFTVDVTVRSATQPRAGRHARHAPGADRTHGRRISRPRNRRGFGQRGNPLPFESFRRS
jgi:hypothetical protein